jgi:hypothetical protein
LSFGLESTLKKELVIENVRAICWIVPKNYPNSRLIDYVKSINKKVGTANSGKEFSEITENNKSRKVKEFKSKAETAIGL